MCSLCFPLVVFLLEAVSVIAAVVPQASPAALRGRSTVLSLPFVWRSSQLGSPLDSTSGLLCNVRQKWELGAASNLASHSMKESSVEPFRRRS